MAVSVVTGLGVGSALAVWIIANRFSEGLSAWAQLSFLPAILLTLGVLFFEIRRRTYSLHAVHLFALLVLLEMAPLLQSLRGVFPTGGGLVFLEREVLWANFQVFVWLGVYLLGYRVASIWARRTSGPLPRPLLSQPLRAARSKIGALIGLAALGYLGSLGLGGALTRAAYQGILGATGGVQYLVTSVFVRAIPVVALAALLVLALEVRGQRRPGTILLLISLALGVLWFDNPVAAARYWTATVLLGFFVVGFMRGRRTGGLLICALVVGVFLLPALNVGRTEERVSAVAEGLPTSVRVPDYLATSGDFDAYANLLLTARYVDEAGPTWGRQFLGVALFWVPRNLWPSKPVGSGYEIAVHMGFLQKNIASPLPAEALINLGWLGIPILALLFGATLGHLDGVYHRRSRWRRREPRVIDALYPFWLGMVLFVTRGDLLSSFAYLAGITLAGLLATLSIPFPALASRGSLRVSRSSVLQRQSGV